MALPNPAHSADSLAQFSAVAYERRAGNLLYGGEVTPKETFDFISQQPAIVVDVRTAQEWQSVGVPELNKTQGKLITLSWKTLPNYALNPAFADQLSGQVANKNTPLFFLCRSGGRSLDAAVAMSAAGYCYCFNVTGGFEGGPDPVGGQVPGWKTAFPWKQA